MRVHTARERAAAAPVSWHSNQTEDDVTIAELGVGDALRRGFLISKDRTLPLDAQAVHGPCVLLQISAEEFGQCVIASRGKAPHSCPKLSHEELAEQLRGLGRPFADMGEAELATVAEVARDVVPLEEMPPCCIPAAEQADDDDGYCPCWEGHHRVLIRQAARPRSLYLLLQGRAVVVSNPDVEDKHNGVPPTDELLASAQMIESIEAPSIFGEAAIVHNGRRTATVVAAATPGGECNRVIS